MKRVLVGAMVFLLFGSMGNAATQVATFTETFNNGNQTVDFADSTGELNLFQNNSGTGVWWAGWSASSGKIQVTANQLRFTSTAAVQGSRAYTRFDSQSADAMKNVSTFFLDLSTDESSIAHDINGNMKIAYLIHTDDNKWFESSEVTAAAAPLTTLVKDLTWREVDASAGTPGADMDEVDTGSAAAGDSGKLTYVTGTYDADPNLAHVDGFGIVVVTVPSPSANVNIAANQNTLTITGAPLPSAVSEWISY